MKVNLGYLSASILAATLAITTFALAQVINANQGRLSVDGVPFNNTANDQIVGAGTGLVQDESQVATPVYASGGCTTTPTITGSPFAFTFTNGASGCSGNTLTLTMPTAGNNGKWVCDAHDITNPTTTFVEESAASSGTSVTFTNYTRTTGAVLTWVAGDVILIKCLS